MPYPPTANRQSQTQPPLHFMYHIFTLYILTQSHLPWLNLVYGQFSLLHCICIACFCFLVLVVWLEGVCSGAGSV
ncbi:hypothetical protein P154DRAFT_57847 [Amniculicola lignicola CBS 123094]|uniref:Uncharacterized protein n=1 Tax=Amniculicola lignicola CBS 123094 TaxID=1392246 RepID=A0A6A5VW22_9PLEO|nr:hypothetical protein P154DRAFT_57847 [Amniculicola lignicola CBS 123094]